MDLYQRFPKVPSGVYSAVKDLIIKNSKYDLQYDSELLKITLDELYTSKIEYFKNKQNQILDKISKQQQPIDESLDILFSVGHYSEELINYEYRVEREAKYQEYLITYPLYVIKFMNNLRDTDLVATLREIVSLQNMDIVGARNLSRRIYTYGVEYSDDDDNQFREFYTQKLAEQIVNQRDFHQYLVMNTGYLQSKYVAEVEATTL